MDTEFDVWNDKKKKIHSENQNKFYHQREVWWCSLGINIGFEQNGKGSDFARPVLVLKGFSRNVLLCVPLTTRKKKGKYYCQIELGDNLQRSVILSQLRLIDSKRLEEKICTLDISQFETIKRKIIQLIE